MISFASDNNSGVHPRILLAIEAANTGHAVGYGDDPWTREMQAAFRKVFGQNAEAWPVFTGTAANTLSVKTLTRPWNAVICAQTAHLNVHECGAPEQFTGCKLLVVPTTNGKITPADIDERMVGVGDEHMVQPRVVSITQTTETGTVYSLEEITALVDCAHGHGLLLHLDGARLANAVAALGCNPQQMVEGVDVMSFGGTKNGMLCGEAVVFLRPGLSGEFPYVRKQGMQLASKMRYLSAQFPAYFADDLWLQNARHANAMARLLAEKVDAVDGVERTQPVDSNAVFAQLPRAAAERLLDRFFFYWWDEHACEARWMCSFDTTEAHIDAFVAALREVLDGFV